MFDTSSFSHSELASYLGSVFPLFSTAFTPVYGVLLDTIGRKWAMGFAAFFYSAFSGVWATPKMSSEASFDHSRRNTSMRTESLYELPYSCAGICRYWWHRSSHRLQCDHHRPDTTARKRTLSGSDDVGVWGWSELGWTC